MYMCSTYLHGVSNDTINYYKTKDTVCAEEDKLKGSTCLLR